MKITTNDNFVSITVNNPSMDMKQYIEVTYILSQHGKMVSYSIHDDNMGYYYVTYQMKNNDYFNELAKFML